MHEIEDIDDIDNLDDRFLTESSDDEQQAIIDLDSINLNVASEFADIEVTKKAMITKIERRDFADNEAREFYLKELKAFAYLNAYDVMQQLKTALANQKSWAFEIYFKYLLELDKNINVNTNSTKQDLIKSMLSIKNLSFDEANKLLFLLHKCDELELMHKQDDNILKYLTDDQISQIHKIINITDA